LTAGANYQLLLLTVACQLLSWWRGSIATKSVLYGVDSNNIVVL
jgi:hypothetical protein